jgi:hypothetical protein
MTSGETTNMIDTTYINIFDLIFGNEILFGDIDITELKEIF